MEAPLPLEPIPTPPAQRWREIRLLYLPRGVFVVAVLVAAWLWNHQVGRATLVAEAEVQQADVRSPRAGVISSLSVGLLERVAAGDVVGFVKASDVGSNFSTKAPDATGKLADLGATSPLVAKMDGVVSEVIHHPGEIVASGESILRITSKQAGRLTGYLRQPLPFEPQPGMLAEVRTRGATRQSAITTITGVGAAMETIPAGIIAAMRLPDKQEKALRVHLAMPRGFNVRPGENVDVIVH